MMVPCHNPDGMDLIVENYRKNVGPSMKEPRCLRFIISMWVMTTTVIL